jgi:hypothetical protein
MSKIEFNLSINLDDKASLSAAATFFATLAGSENVKTISGKRDVTNVETLPAPKKTPTKASSKKSTTKAAPKVDDQGTNDQEGQKPIIVIDEIRKLLSEKVEKHREAIKAKLTEFRAPNVTNLDPAKYEEFYEFMEKLG